MLLQLVKPNDRVLVFGAHIGYHGVLMSKIIGDQGKIWLFEANPMAVKFLRANILLNDITNATIYPKAVFSSNTKLQLKQIAAGNTGASHLVTSNVQDAIESGVNIITIDAVNIDSIAEISQVDVIQMDIEGAEPDAIYGAKNLINNSPNLIVLQEWSTIMTKNIDTYLAFWRARGYRAAVIRPDSLQEISDEDLRKENIHIDILWAKNLDEIIANFKGLE
jgi:FkbM family methyltransferase